MRRWWKIAGAAVVLAIAAAAVFFFSPAGEETAVASANQPSGAALIARGEYLARAGDCAACHTAPGGQPFAGGLAFRLPFGTIYAPNITPDRETGIGAWSDADFLRALHRGIGRNGENLYPAFPYPSYALLSTDDVLAIRAYLATVPPVHAAMPANTLSFPFNQRYLMRAWNLLYLPSHRWVPAAAKDPAWSRGEYLVEALGHCGDCHTPRDAMMGLDQARKFAGAEQVGWFAYNLTGDPGSGLGRWTDAALAQYLSTGHADGHGPASGPMAEVVEHSLRYLAPDDIRAMVSYLRSVPAQAGGPPAARPGPPVAGDPLGARLFVQACMGCHLPDGAGRQSAWAALQGSHSAADPSATNLVQVLTRGARIETGWGPMFMHPFTGAYSDAELASLANYVIAQFGFRQGQVTPAQIETARAAP
jgi:mono/diheme cytochrome c family protein